MAGGHSRTPRGGFGEVVEIIDAPPVAPVAKKPLIPMDEEYEAPLMLGLIAVLNVVMWLDSGWLGLKASGMAFIIVFFWFGSTGRLPAHAAFPAAFVLAVITVWIPPDAQYFKNTQVQKKADEACAARHVLVQQCKSVLGEAQTKKSFLDLVGISYNPRNASHNALAMGK